MWKHASDDLRSQVSSRATAGEPFVSSPEITSRNLPTFENKFSDYRLRRGLFQDDSDDDDRPARKRRLTERAAEEMPAVVEEYPKNYECVGDDFYMSRKEKEKLIKLLEEAPEKPPERSQYNMKIIIKGDRNVGKSSLFNRLQGLKFKEDYLLTQESQTACIEWYYKATDDDVKVEVWDVVDKKKKKKMEDLKLDNSLTDVVDVYKGTNGVIMMFDITKLWTYEYVQRELVKIPNNIPVLIFANYEDMSHYRVVNRNDIKHFIRVNQRPSTAAQISYAAASMRMDCGLEIKHEFFNWIFLQIHRETLLKNDRHRKFYHFLSSVFKNERKMAYCNRCSAWAQESLMINPGCGHLVCYNCYMFDEDSGDDDDNERKRRRREK